MNLINKKDVCNACAFSNLEIIHVGFFSIWSYKSNNKKLKALIQSDFLSLSGLNEIMN